MSNVKNGMIRERTKVNDGLERVRAFVASHGVDTWIEEGAVAIVSHVSHGLGQWSKVTDKVATLADARAVLGY